MKQDKARKVISIGLAVLFALSGLLVLFPVSAHASWVTDLTGTTWQLDSLSCEAGYGFFNIEHEIILGNDISDFQSQFYIGYYLGGRVPTPVDDSVASAPSRYVWRVNDVVSFYGGDDVTNQDLISWLDGHASLLFAPATPTPTPTPTASPSPTPSPTPSVDSFYSPFKSFAGTYYNDTALFFPNSVTKHQYAQYSGIVADHNMTITDIRSTLQYNAGNYVVYKFEYDILPLTSADFRFDFLFDSESDLPSVYVSYLFNGQVFECDDFEQTYLTGIYTQYGAYDIDPTQTFGPPFYAWDVDLTSQRSLGVEIEGLKHDNTSVTPITITLYISSTPMPGFGSSFDWAQLFEDTRPDSAFLTTVSSLSSLPFFVGGLGFLALGAVIGIVLKFMR